MPNWSSSLNDWRSFKRLLINLLNLEAQQLWLMSWFGLKNLQELWINFMNKVFLVLVPCWGEVGLLTQIFQRWGTEMKVRWLWRGMGAQEETCDYGIITTKWESQEESKRWGVWWKRCLPSMGRRDDGKLSMIRWNGSLVPTRGWCSGAICHS